MTWRGEPQWSGATSDFHLCKLFATIQIFLAVKSISNFILIFLIFSITGYNALPPNDMEATMTHLANVVSKQNSTNDYDSILFVCFLDGHTEYE